MGYNEKHIYIYIYSEKDQQFDEPMNWGMVIHV